MTSATAAIQIQNAMNKLHSSDYVNIELWKMQEAVNMASQRFTRRRLPNKERDSITSEDISILLNPEPLKLAGTNKETYFVSTSLPKNYFGLSRVGVRAQKDECIHLLPSEWVEDANADDYLGDWSTQPSFDFEQVFHTLSGGRIKAYHGGDFTIKELELTYYRQPQYIQMPGASLPSGGTGRDMTWEWKDDIADLIIEEAVWILSGNTGDYNRNQIAAQVIQPH